MSFPETLIQIDKLNGEITHNFFMKLVNFAQSNASDYRIV